MFFEVHGGQFHYLWPNTRYTQAPAYQDLATNIVTGGNQDGWFRDITRNQVLGSMSYFKDNWAGNHNFKVGGEFFNERYDDLRGQDGLGQVPNDVLMLTRNRVPTEVILFQTPSASLNGLWTTGLYASDVWRVSSRADVHARSRLRPLPVVSSRTDRSARRALQCDAGEFPRSQ